MSPATPPRVIAGALLLLLLSVSSALSHSELTEADPGPDVVVSPPTELVARFSQDLRPDRTSIEVRDAAGSVVASGGKDPDRARVQRMALPSLAPGAYEVRWVSFSAEDGELARGRYGFTVVAAPAESPSPSPSASCLPGPAPSATPVALGSPSPSPSPAPISSPSPSALAVPSLSATDPCIPDAVPGTSDASASGSPMP